MSQRKSVRCLTLDNQPPPCIHFQIILDTVCQPVYVSPVPSYQANTLGLGPRALDPRAPRAPQDSEPDQGYGAPEAPVLPTYGQEECRQVTLHLHILHYHLLPGVQVQREVCTPQTSQVCRPTQREECRTVQDQVSLSYFSSYMFYNHVFPQICTTTSEFQCNPEDRKVNMILI